MLHWMGPGKPPLPPKAHSHAGPSRQQDEERCTPGRAEGPSLQGAGALGPSSEAFWDDSGHGLSIVGDQGATKAWRTRLI